MIINSYDTNTILLYPMKSKLANEFQQIYDDVYTYLTKRGYKPQFHRIDNELADSIKQHLE